MIFIKNVLKPVSLTRIMSFYAVAKGHQIGIYDTWDQCEKQVKGFKGAKYKKFVKRDEAERFIQSIPEGANEVICKQKNSKSKYLPQNSAVALGQKGPVQWPSEDPNSKKDLSEKIADCWPVGETDSNDISEADMLFALAEVEGISHIANSENPPASTVNKKRKANVLEINSKSHKVPKHVSKIWEPVGLKYVGGYEFQIDEEGFIIVYTDGSCIGNGKANACAGFGVYFGENHPLNAGQPVTGRVTNNVGEIQASIYAIEKALEVGIGKLCLSTDSQFLINAITLWVSAWKRKDWRLKNGDPVKNVDEFKILDKLLQNDNIMVKWNYVKAHKGIRGNEMADKLAKEGAELYKRLHH